MTAPDPASELPDPLIGRVFGGRFEVNAPIGRGGLGAVYRGTQLSLNQTVAIKVILAEHARDEDAASRFRNEAQIYARLNSPYVVNIHDFGVEDDGTQYLVQEFVPGVDLQQVLEREGPMRMPRMVRLASQITQGLAAAHDSGILHRDIKPANVMIRSAETDNPFATLLDFGLGKLRSQRSEGPGKPAPLPKGLRLDLTRAGLLAGTPVYMAPEQWAGAPVDERSDLYALGVMLYQMVAGLPPFIADSIGGLATMHAAEAPPEWTVDAPRAVRTIVWRCLAKLPEDRFSSAGEVMSALDDASRDLMGPQLVSLLEADERYDEGPVPVSRRTFGDDAEPATEDSRQVIGELCATLARAYNQFVMYPADNPVFEHAADAVCELADRFFEGAGQLALNVDRFALYHGKDRVYEDTNLRASYPFKLFADGIRRLYFLKGLTRSEVLAYLECLHVVSARALPGSDLPGSDIVTLLWERRLEHIKYHLVEDLVEEGTPFADIMSGQDEPAEGTGDEGRYHGQARTRPVARKATGGPAAEWREIAAQIPSNPPEPWTEAERAKAAEEVEKDAAADHLSRFIGSLIGVLLRAPADEDLEPPVRALADLLRGALSQGDVNHALVILGPVNTVITRTRKEALRDALKPVAAIAAEPRWVLRIVATLNEASTPAQQRSAGAFLNLLGPSATPALFASLQTVGAAGLPVVQTVLLSHCKNDPALLRIGLTDPGENTIRASLQIASRVPGPETAKRIAATLTHGSPSVRVAVIAALTKRRDPGLATRMAPMLEDPSDAVRIAAIRALPSVRDDRAARRALLTMLRSEDLAQQSRGEHKALFGALVKLGDADVCSAVRTLLDHREDPWLRRMSRVLSESSDGSEVLAEPAARCLESIGSVEAIDALKHLSGNGAERTRRACERALKRLEGP